ncbi:hypothetical protein EYF80_002856 [Liparis tanakae]|uniref:Uncharacterized protein n=1 Tax=Liparis tanakae TaxID=230148 RepID=A0A4Z2JAV8_9TELE|nr:hypothetical protein EYF80_002856 [Liparis tanakae]
MATIYGLSEKRSDVTKVLQILIHPSPTAGSITAASSVSTIQGKPSLRRIKGRIHRSKSLDSLDLLDSHMPPPTFSFKSSNGICGKSPYVSNIAGPLCSSSITFSPYLPLHSLVPEVEALKIGQ